MDNTVVVYGPLEPRKWLETEEAPKPRPPFVPPAPAPASSPCESCLLRVQLEAWLTMLLGPLTAEQQERLRGATCCRGSS